MAVRNGATTSSFQDTISWDRSGIAAECLQFESSDAMAGQHLVQQSHLGRRSETAVAFEPQTMTRKWGILLFLLSCAGVLLVFLVNQGFLARTDRKLDVAE